MPSPYQLWIPFKQNTITPEDNQLRRELHQNWLEIENWANLINRALGGGNDSFDAIVDPDLAADNPGQHQFTTVASAIITMYGLGYTTTLRIGVKASTTVTSDTVAVGTSNTPTYVYIVGLHPGHGAYPLTPSSSVGAKWPMGTIRHNWGGSFLYCRDLFISQTTTTAGFFSTNSPSNFTLERCVITCSSAVSGGQRIASTNLFLKDTQLDFVHHTGNRLWWSGGYYVDSTHTAVTWGSGNSNTSAYVEGVEFTTGSGTFTQTWQYSTNMFLGDIFTYNSWSVGSGFSSLTVLTFPNANVAVVYDGSMGHRWEGITSVGVQTVDINVTASNPRFVIIDGMVNNITVPASTVSDSGSVGHAIRGTATGLVDVTGPAVLDLNVQSASGLKIRGDGVVGNLRVSYASSSGTVIDYIAATRSNIEASINRNGASSTQKGYAFDASSSRNILIITGLDAMPTSSTDAGSNNLVVTESGTAPTGAAGGDLSGTYPNPDVVDDSHSHTTATLPATLTLTDGTRDFTAQQDFNEGFRVQDGANEYMGTAVLVAGTVTVNNTKVLTGSRVFFTVQVTGGTQGNLSLGTVVNTTSFDINSDSILDTSTVAWLIINPA